MHYGMLNGTQDTAEIMMPPHSLLFLLSHPRRPDVHAAMMRTADYGTHNNLSVCGLTTQRTLGQLLPCSAGLQLSMQAKTRASG